MLAAHDAAGSFGDRPLFAAGAAGARLPPGTAIGTFLVERLLGAGGMGEVYRAQDTRLGRAVAIKVLPDAVAQDADRRSRFEQEARALAALNHPGIGAIYGVEESGDVVALVLELVEGPTLAEALAAGPLAIEDVVSTARQIAEALEAAHDRGIIHRDLKPANVKVTPEGAVKVLDFGLAKAMGRTPSSPAQPTGPQVTELGMIVGTAAYMSPEQGRGLPVDKRTDIWSFGCVTFEMCAGQPPFAGVTPADTLAAVIAQEPEWSRLAPATPAPIVHLLRRCLMKDPKQRLRDIGEARIALATGQALQTVTAPLRLRRGAAILAAAALLAATTLVLAAYYRDAPRLAAPAPQVRFPVPPPAGGVFASHPALTFHALSPDGSQLAFVAATDKIRVWLRPLAELDARPVPGTEGATSVFWSPDGRSIAFFAGAKLKRVDLRGGSPMAICDVPASNIAHGTWGSGGVILVGFSQGSAILRVEAAGGSPREWLTPNRANGEVRVHWPSFLPDGRRFLYTARRDDGEGELRIGDLEDAVRTRALMPIASNAQWVAPDLVLFVREGVLTGQRVNLDAARRIGEPFSIASHLEYLYTTSRAMFSVSQSGTVAYHRRGELAQLAWADRRGSEVETIGNPAEYEFQSARLSRDGTMLLTARREPGLGTFDVWRLDLARKTEERLTDHRGAEVTPIFSTDGREIFFAADRGGSVPSVFRKDLIGGGEHALLPRGVQQLVMDVIPGENAIVYIQRSKAGKFDIFRLPLEAGASPKAIVESRLDKFDVRVSPDGRAIAYAATDGSRTDLYVAPWPMTSAPIVAASGIRGTPRWDPSGRQIYYVARVNQVMSIGVDTGARLTAGLPKPVFQLKREAILLDVARDGRFLLLVRQVRAQEQPLIVATAAVEAGGHP